MKRAISSLRSDDEKSVIEKRLQGYLKESDLQTLLQEKGPFETVSRKLWMKDIISANSVCTADRQLWN